MTHTYIHAIKQRAAGRLRPNQVIAEVDFGALNLPIYQGRLNAYTLKTRNDRQL